MTTRNAPSGPGRFSSRTDRGSASLGRADLTGTGRKYGEAKALNAQADAAPVPKAGAVPAPLSRGDGAGAPDGAQAGAGLFGPTTRPSEPITAGSSVRPDPARSQYAGNDTDMVLEMLYKAWPDPNIAALMNR